MLDIQRGVDIDTGIEQFLDILVAFGMPGTGNIGVGEFIDKHKRRFCLERCIEIELREQDPPVFHHLPGNDGKTFKQLFGLRPAVGLDIPGCHINSFGAPEVCRPEHLVGLPDTRNVPEEDFQLAPVLPPLLTLHAGEEEIGIGTTFRSDNHKNRITPHPSVRAPYR